MTDIKGDSEKAFKIDLKRELISAEKNLKRYCFKRKSISFQKLIVLFKGLSSILIRINQVLISA